MNDLDYCTTYHGLAFFCDMTLNDACEAFLGGVGCNVLLHEYGMTMLNFDLHSQVASAASLM
jgi:hypothetical protein